ncbi:hypothetical protein LX80_01762 [Hydrotalea sandarakina]|jgi:hypothetical protein|uniref:Uncharacterized protein n=1 Tax=Hydrotalea sandarakina TaxID=1004304 RepID=A0A2W7RUN5_9BACT|nr:hypothetical protein LX80_01762 [Hydrotalea sandarakina]
MQQIWQRAQAPTPVFFKRLRSLALVLSAIATAVLTAPVSFPPLVVTVAGYVLTAGTVAGAISQLTVATDATIPALPPDNAAPEPSNNETNE